MEHLARQVVESLVLYAFFGQRKIEGGYDDFLLHGNNVRMLPTLALPAVGRLGASGFAKTLPRSYCSASAESVPWTCGVTRSSSTALLPLCSRLEGLCAHRAYLHELHPSNCLFFLQR